MRDQEYYINEVKSVKELKLQAIDSITLVSLAALLADYHQHMITYPDCTLDEFYDFKKELLSKQKADSEDWQAILERDPNFQVSMENQDETNQNIKDKS